MKLILSTSIAGLMVLGATPAQAANLVGVFEGNDCTGTFSECFATQDGTNEAEGALSSPSVVKFNGSEADLAGGLDPFQLSEVSSLFPSIDGSEFVLGFDNITKMLTFTYNPGSDDPALHYFTIKQGSRYALFYDATPILSGSVDLSGIDFGQAGSGAFSHITFFDTGIPAVPEPSTWAMMLLGFGAIGFAMRRRRQTSSDRIRVRFAF